MVEGSELTDKQLENSLSQCVRNLYFNHLGHQPNTVSCQLVDKTLTIIVEDSITLPEQLLNKSGHVDLAKQVRSNIEKIVEVHIKQVIEEVCGIPIIELFSNSALDTRRTSIVAVLATAAIVTKQQRGQGEDSDG